MLVVQKRSSIIERSTSSPCDVFPVDNFDFLLILNQFTLNYYTPWLRFISDIKGLQVDITKLLYFIYEGIILCSMGRSTSLHATPVGHLSRSLNYSRRINGCVVVECCTDLVANSLTN